MCARYQSIIPALTLSVVVAAVHSTVHVGATTSWIPGFQPRSYADGQRVVLHMREMRSLTQPGITRDFYDVMPAACAPASTKSEWDNLGEALSGGLSQPSLYELHATRDMPCTVLCTARMTADNVSEWRERIEEGYRMQMSADSLPAVQQTTYYGPDGEELARYDMGVPIGYLRPKGAASHLAHNGSDEAYMYTHLDIKVQYHADSDDYDGVRIVGFFVTPRAAACTTAEDGGHFGAGAPLHTGEVKWTYRVRWEEAERSWDARWNVYALPDMARSSSSVHYASIAIAALVMLILVVGAHRVLARYVSRDVARYLDPEDRDGVDTGWKMVSGDVFRPPRAPALLSAIVGTGVQLAVMVVLTLVFAAVGLTTDYYRGVMLSTVIVLYMLLSSLGTYVSARVYRGVMRGTRPVLNFVLTWGLLPALVSLVFLVTDVMLASVDSAAHVGAPVIAGVAAVWLGVSLGLAVIGYLVGHRTTATSIPVNTNQIPRQEHDVGVHYNNTGERRGCTGRLVQRARRTTLASALFVGSLSFGMVLWPFYYVFASWWAGRMYTLFAALLVVFFNDTATTEIYTMLFTYWYLNWERWHWWWRTLWVGGGAALNVAVFSLVYLVWFMPHTGAEAAGVVYYVFYTLLLVVCVFCVHAAVSFLMTLRLVLSMYTQAKAD
jgi:transmembrane 9 superfamily protein 2/4